MTADATWTVISPHLDDAVFSCGAWMAAHPGTRVVTVFAGVGEDPTQVTDWDRRCGLRNAADALKVRRDEDRRALAELQARPHWLPFADAQYGGTPDCDALASALGEVLRATAADRVLLPLGLYHSDHRLAHDAALQALQTRGVREVVVYEDALYRGLPGVLQQRLVECLHAGCTATPTRRPGPPQASGQHVAAKRRAVAAYASQLRAFGPSGTDDLLQPERLWRLVFDATETRADSACVDADAAQDAIDTER